ncbi:MAG: Trk system potassium transporter TrkA [Bacteroidaceae bacterium]|nr:Trk system potassium transporter TrkA [Bacteroidaceae bacterium]
MKILIAGAGEVGSHLAKLLSKEDQEIIIVDSDVKRLLPLESENLERYHGDPSSFQTLYAKEAGKTDLFIAVTPNEHQNINSCSIAKHYGAKRTVARIDNFEYFKQEHSDFFEHIGVDELIYPEYLASQEVLNALKHTWTRNWFELFDGELVVVGVKLRKEAEIIGKTLRDMTAISGVMHISAIKRNKEIIIPRGNDVVELNDIVYIATTKPHIDDVVRICNKTSTNVKKVLIMGGGRITRQIVSENSPYQFTIIEKDREVADQLSELYPECDIVCGDGCDPDLWANPSLGLMSHDAFVALTESSEVNILACIAAKGLHIKKTIAEVENLQFINEAESLNIGTVINKKLLASSAIFQILLDADTSTSKCLALSDAEVAEIIVKENSKVTHSKIKELKLSDDMTIAGLVRDGKGMLVKGDTRLHAGDHVIVFCLRGALYKVEKLFS